MLEISEDRDLAENEYGQLSDSFIAIAAGCIW